MQVKTLRRWNNALHRDIGYLCVGMTIIYAVSGIVLNHFRSGDFAHPDFSKSYQEYKVSPPLNGVVDQAYINLLVDQFSDKKHYKSFISGEDYVQIFLTNGSLYVDLTSNTAQLEKKNPRYLIKEFNLLHYNNIKQFYTWFSDFYAVCLIILAITGLFILRGKNGIVGRGAWLTVIGIIIPALIIIFFA